MINDFAVILTEGLMLVAVWRLLGRRDLDDETASHASAPNVPAQGRRPRA